MLTIFKSSTWILICIIFILSAVVWYFFGRVTREHLSHKQAVLVTFNSWCVFLGVATNNRPDLNPLRIFFLTFTLYAMNITTIYSSKLINVFTHPPYEEQIDTVEEIVDSFLPIGRIFFYSIHFFKDFFLSKVNLN